MKTLRNSLVVLNAIVMLNAIMAALVLVGNEFQLIHLVFYGMAIGSMLGEQKRAFHYITIALGVSYIALGFFLFFGPFFYDSFDRFMELIGWLLLMLFVFGVIPAANIYYIVVNRLAKA